MAPIEEATFTAYHIPISVITLWPAPSPHPVTRRWYVPHAIVLQALATISIAIRFYALARERSRKFGIDDVFIIASWFFAFGFTVVSIWGVLHAGFDRHTWENVATGEISGLTAWISEGLFFTSTCLTKLSILTFQRRLLTGTFNVKFLRAIDAAIVFMVATIICFTLLLIFSCQPVEAAWKSANILYSKPYHCNQRHVADSIVGTISIASDVYALIIPEFLVHSLRIKARQKAILYLVFGCGFLATGAGIARTVWISRLSSDPMHDVSWTGYQVIVWGQVECQLAVLCASAPALKGFISNFKSKASRNRSDKSNATPLSPLKASKKSNFTTTTGTMDEEAAEGKGILVTETISLQSITRDDQSAHSNRHSLDFEHYAHPPQHPDELHEHPNSSRPLTCITGAAQADPEDPFFFSQSSPTSESQGSTREPRGSSESLPNAARQAEWDYMQRPASAHPLNTWRAYDKQEKAMRVLGG